MGSLAWVLGVLAAVAGGPDGGRAGSSNLLIRLERSGCNGTCPIYAVEVDADGRVRYEGRGYVMKEARESGRVNAAALAVLRGAIVRARFSDLPGDSCRFNEETAQATVFVTVADGRPPKTIIDYQGCDATSAGVRELERTVDDIVNIERWIGTREKRAACFPGRLREPSDPACFSRKKRAPTRGPHPLVERASGPGP